MEVRDLVAWPSQRLGEAEGSLIQEMLVRVAATLLRRDVSALPDDAGPVS